MASGKPGMTRDGTMQVTAKEGINLLKAAGKNTLLEMQGLQDPEPEKPSVARAGTMQVTAEEGAEFLERQANKDAESSDDEEGEDGEADGESNNVDDKPAVQRDSTMEVTAKEGQSLLAGEKLDPDATTRGQQKKMVQIAEDDEDEDEEGTSEEEEEEEEEAPAPKRPRLSKGVTMVNTAKEAKSLLGDKAPDVDAMTRGQQKKIADLTAEKPSPKKPKLSKNTTMAATAKEGAALIGDEKLGDTRAVSKAKQAKGKAAMKRHTTIQKTVEEAAWVVDVNVNEGRKTRSAKRPAPKKAAAKKPAAEKKPATPKLKKAGTMVNTAKEGKEFLSRGKKGRKGKKAAPKYAESSEEESDDEVAA